MVHPRTTMLPRAEYLVEMLRPFCERIEIGGSLRRMKAEVKDIEIVAVPVIDRNLFGEPNDGPTRLVRFLDELKGLGTLAPRTRANGQRIAEGPRFQALLFEGLSLDLFMVMPPAEWGAVFAIRTGPGDYSKHLVTVCQDRGLRCRDGALWRGSTKIETPEEEDFFRECGVRWVPPEERTSPHE